MFANPYFIALGIPFLLIVLGAIARKLIRGRWVREDCFLGVELALASISSGLIYLSELITAKRTVAGCSTARCVEILRTTDGRLLSDAGYLGVAFLALLFILSIHQTDPDRPRKPLEEWLALGVVANGVGGVVLALFILVVKGIDG
jgi:hypothetical protein